MKRSVCASGRGYVPAEQNKTEFTPISVIPVDSIYTPVTRVNYTVENTRVGQVTDYDKLILELWTDGSITPEEGVSIGAKIMLEHLNLFIGLGSDVKGMEFMIEKDEDCAEVLMQLSAVNSALRSLGKEIINEHMTHCITHAIEDGDTEAVEEFQKAIKKFI